MNQFRPYVNRLVKLKEMQITDTNHTLNMKEMKPITTKLMQHAQAITINRSKREKLREVRDIEIERENKILLNKIDTLNTKKGKYSVVKTKSTNKRASISLNQLYRKQQMQSIERQNQQLFQRINQQRATLDNSKLQKDWEDKKKIAKKMANLQYNTIFLKERELRKIKTERMLLPMLGKIKMSKVKVIDGCKMLIRVEVNDENVKIIGDFCDNKDLKVLQIPKEEAIVIVQSKFKGKLQHLIDHLQYDKPTQTLHLTIEDSNQTNPFPNNIAQKANKTHRLNKSTLDNLNNDRQKLSKTAGKNVTANKKAKVNSQTLLNVDKTIENKEEENYQQQFQDVQPQKDKNTSLIAQEKYEQDFEQNSPK